jgi:predicted negative regulator of RcsB-dependent stress response
MYLSNAAILATDQELTIIWIVVTALIGLGGLIAWLVNERRNREARDEAARNLKVLIWFEQLLPSRSASIEEAATGVELAYTETKDAVESLISAGKIERIRGLSRFRFRQH